MKKIIVFLHIALTAFFIYFDFVNFKPHTADVFKYCVVILSFATSAALIKSSAGRRDAIILSAGLFVTVLTDYFLVLADWLRIPQATDFFLGLTDRYVIGMILYCAVMVIYFFRYHSAKRAVIIPVFIIIPLFLHFYLRMNALTVVCSFYAQALAANIISAVVSVKNGKFHKTNAILILMGMFIFLLGDAAVIMTNFFMIQIFRKIIWLFYAPSLALLSFSGYDFSKKARYVKP